MIKPELAENIISEMNHLIQEELIVADTSGTIIASTDKSRVGTFHEGALICIQEKNTRVITEEDQKTLKGVKAGINLPVFFQNQIAGVIGITGDPGRVSPYGEILRRMTELLMNERYYSEQVEWRARALEAFVFDWVQKSDWTEEFISQGELLGVDLKLDRQVLIGHCSSEKEGLISHQTLLDLMQSFTNETADVFVRWGNDRFVILMAGHKKKERTHHFAGQIRDYLKNRYGLDLSIGIGQPASPQHVPLSFQQAERALNTAKKTKGIVFDDDLRLEMLLKEIKKETKMEFVSRTIRSMEHERELVDTLQTFILQNQSFKAAADVLHIHINTLHYRMKRIEELTGLNPRHTHDMTILYLALLFLDEQPKKE